MTSVTFPRDSARGGRGPEDQGGIFETNTKPQFKKIPADLEVREGNPVRLDCIVSGRPIPEFFWYRNEVQVHNDDNHKVRSVWWFWGMGGLLK